MTDSTPDLPPGPEQEPVPSPRPRRREPILNLPGPLVSVIIVMAAIYVAQAALLSNDTVDYIDFEFGFIPARYVYPLFAGDYAWIWSPLSYSFLHGSIEHLLFNCLWLMSFGTPVVRRIGTRRSVLFWIASSFAAAAFYAALHWGEVQLVIGASGVISAFMGAACRFAFPPRMLAFDRRPVHLYPRLTLRQMMASRTAVSFLLLGIIGNLALAFGLPLAGTGNAPIAWEAHIGGLLFGLLVFPLFDRNPPQPDPIYET